jgi:hypothetical protein
MPVRGHNAGNRGQGSKWLSPRKRAAIYARDGHACVWCGGGAVLNVLTVDHLIPRSRGGGNEASNLVTACMACNRLRGDRPISEWINSYDGVTLRLARAIDNAPTIPGFRRRVARRRVRQSV